MNKKKDPQDLLKRGRPSPYDPEFHNQDFLRRSKEGESMIQIASEWGLHVDTLYEWGKKHAEFSDTLKLGKQFAEAYYIRLGHAGGMLGVLKDKNTGKPIKVDLGFYRVLTHNKFGWSDNSKNQVSGKLQVNTFVDLIKELEEDEEQ